MSDQEGVENERLQPPRQRGDYADNWKHIKLEYLIHSDAHFIVFIDRDGDVDWETTPTYDAKGHANDTKHNQILNDTALLETTPCAGLSREVKLHFKRLIGEAIVRSLDHDYANGEKMLDAARRYILSRSLETSRRWYLSASGALALPFVIVGVGFWLAREHLLPFLGFVLFWLVIAAVAGALGALLSVATRAGDLRFDCSAGRTLHILEAASRIGTGAISGIIVALAVHSEIILAPLSRGGKMTAVMTLAAFAAGATERLATSIISRFSTLDAGTEHTKTAPPLKEQTHA